MNTHAKRAEAFVQNEERTNWHDGSLWHVRQKRDTSSHGIPEWEQLRTWGSQIKDHTLSQLDTYLETFERQAKANGAIVHWAEDAAAHNRIVGEILARHHAKKLVKSKSMLTEECKLNEYLDRQGIEVVDTDLGERIIQLRKEGPSHIVMPAIHLKKKEIGELFHEKLGTEKGSEDPQYLVEAARQHLREKFLNADAALTGVNFAIAETGGIVVCTNEGNADMGVHAVPLQIHSMGIEKVIPRQQDLGVFTRLLGRSGTGQPITIYTSHHHRPKPGGEMHIIIVDNGRSEQLGRDSFRNSLKCIRCGACMNTCPIYRRSGGHSYGYTVPGPIGSILTPGIDLKKFSSLPFASTLCGSCSDVCPVKINIHEQLYQWRQIIVSENEVPVSKRIGLTLMGKVLASPAKLNFWGKTFRTIRPLLPRLLLYNPLNAWGKARELPESPKESFSDWYKRNRTNHESK